MNKQDRATVHIPNELKRQARIKAISEGKNLSLVMRELLLAWLAGKIELPQEKHEG